jgi:hypothetical protein
MLNTRAKKNNNLLTVGASACSGLQAKEKKRNGGYHADSISHTKKRKDFVSMPQRATWFYARNV